MRERTEHLIERMRLPTGVSAIASEDGASAAIWRGTEFVGLLRFDGWTVTEVFAPRSGAEIVAAALGQVNDALDPRVHRALARSEDGAWPDGIQTRKAVAPMVREPVIPARRGRPPGKRSERRGA
jgi:hypothetical protein